MTASIVAGAVVVAFAAWFALFGRGREDIWPRTWAIAAALIGYSVLVLGLQGELVDVIGPLGVTEAGLGAAVGVVWLAATHVGHAVLCRVFPSFVEQVRDLYGLGAGDPATRVVGPLLVMAAAEELLFRGVIQSSAGLVAGVAAYTVVQVVERKWALVLAAFLGGTIWGGLFALTDGLLAPFPAHALWTVGLTLVWPLRGCRAGDRVETPADATGSNPAVQPVRSKVHAQTATPRSEGRDG